MWIYPLISQRLLKGQSRKLYEHLRACPRKNMGYFRMSDKSSDEFIRHHTVVHNIPEHKYKDGYRARRKFSCNSEVRRKQFFHTDSLKI
jgi:hypothetical protein